MKKLLSLVLSSSFDPSNPTNFNRILTFVLTLKHICVLINLFYKTTYDLKYENCKVFSRMTNNLNIYDIFSAHDEYYFD